MEALKQWTQENKITAFGILVVILLALSAGVGNHLLAFGEVKSKVETMSKTVDKHEGIVDAQTVLIQSVDTKVQMLLDAWGIKKPEEEEGE